MRLATISACLLATLSMLASGRNSAPIKGHVTCQGHGVAGVVVSDGIDCVTTDASGAYELEGKRGVRHVMVSTPAGYLVDCKDSTIPQFYLPFDASHQQKSYDFELQKNPLDDTHHTFIAQADAQVTSMDDIKGYGKFLEDVNAWVAPLRGERDLFSIDLGDIVGDSPWLFPPYINTVKAIDMPVYRAIGNHDMTYGGRTYEYSYSTFESYFGPIYYSFNKGKAHYIVFNNNFYVNRDYQYIGYVDERTLAWIDEDLKFVPKDHLVIVVAHIPTSSTKKLAWNTLYQDETSNAQGLWDALKGRNAHIITGHSHFNLNVVFSDSLMEHNTAAVCGVWWKAPVCQDGTPVGYGVYTVDGNKMTWLYKSQGHDADYQLKAYAPGSSKEYPSDIIANVWNWDEKWRVEWTEDGKKMGRMEQFTGFDPEASEICADKERMVYEWITPIKTTHLWRATPKKSDSKIEVIVTDRWGNRYTQQVR